MDSADGSADGGEPVSSGTDDPVASDDGKAGEMPATHTADSSSASTLTDAQKKRIGPRLRRLIRGEEAGPRPVEAVGTRGDAPVYGIIIYCDDAGALRDAGIPLSTVQGEIISARLTINQIREAATIEVVDAIRAGTKQQQQLHSEPREHERKAFEENGGQ